MKFHEALAQYSDKTILEVLFGLYPDEKKNRKGYEKALVELRKTKPKVTKTRIKIEFVEPNPKDPWFNKEDKPYTCVTILQGKQEYSASFLPWDEWLGATMPTKFNFPYATLDIVAHCLWEVTWYGYSNTQTQEKAKKLFEIVKEVEKK